MTLNAKADHNAILLDTVKAFSPLLQICISSTIEIDARVQKLVQKGNYFYDIRIFHNNNNKNHHKHWTQIGYIIRLIIWFLTWAVFAGFVKYSSCLKKWNILISLSYI